MKTIIITFILSLLYSSQSFAIDNLDCHSVDKTHPACALSPIGGGRCFDDMYKWSCNQSSGNQDKCEAIGGCFGQTEFGRWYTTRVGEQTIRCKC